MAENSIEKKPRAKKEHKLLTRFYDEDVMFELSIDEAGRGCLFGRVYIACVVLPKEPLLFDGTDIKDSKKFSSKKKLNEVAEYIKENAFAWHIAYEESKIVDDINILQAVMKGMHTCIREIRIKINVNKSFFILFLICHIYCSSSKSLGYVFNIYKPYFI